MKSGQRQKMLHKCLNLFLALAPILVTQLACVPFWGEPEVPQSLRD